MKEWNKKHLDDVGHIDGPAGGPVSWPHTGRERDNCNEKWKLLIDVMNHDSFHP